MPPRVQPGDTILLHAGLYKDSRFVYGGFDRNIPALGTPFDGTYYLTGAAPQQNRSSSKQLETERLSSMETVARTCLT